MNTQISKFLVKGLVSLMFLFVFSNHIRADNGNEVIVNGHHVKWSPATVQPESRIKL